MPAARRDMKKSGWGLRTHEGTETSEMSVAPMLRAAGACRCWPLPRRHRATRSTRRLRLAGQRRAGRQRCFRAWARLGQPRRLAPQPRRIAASPLAPTIIGEAFVNSGGFNQGGKYDGVLELYHERRSCTSSACGRVSASTPMATRSTAKASPPDNIGSLMPVSNLEATPRPRVCSSYGSSSICTTTSVAVKFGQLAADAEFIISRRRRLFPERHLGLAVDHRRGSCRVAARPTRSPPRAFASPSLRPTRSSCSSASITAIPAGPNCQAQPAGLRQ